MRQACKNLIVLASVAVLSGATAHASQSDLRAFLERAERMVTHSRAVRADIKITNSDGSSVEAVAIIDGESQSMFFATRDGKWRTLAPLSWDGSGKALSAGSKGPVPFGADSKLADSELRPTAFFPFWQGVNYDTAFISDNTRLQKTVTLYAPKKLPYVLFVMTMDKERIVPVTTKFYAEQMNNLVRLQTDSDHVMVGARPRPQKIVVNNFADNTSTTCELRWKLLESLPNGLLDESTFTSAAIDW